MIGISYHCAIFMCHDVMMLHLDLLSNELYGIFILHSTLYQGQRH